jgi:hypothetical protein
MLLVQLCNLLRITIHRTILPLALRSIFLPHNHIPPLTPQRPSTIPIILILAILTKKLLHTERASWPRRTIHSLVVTPSRVFRFSVVLARANRAFALIGLEEEPGVEHFAGFVDVILEDDGEGFCFLLGGRRGRVFRGRKLDRGEWSRGTEAVGAGAFVVFFFSAVPYHADLIFGVLTGCWCADPARIVRW